MKTVKVVPQCPRCGSDNYWGDMFEVYGDEVSQICGCNECGASWADIYVGARRELHDEEEGES